MHPLIFDIDFKNIDISIVKFLATRYDGDMFFFLPTFVVGIPFMYGKGMGEMDKLYERHPSCATKTSNVRNDFDLCFKQSSFARHLECQNKVCDYFVTKNPGIQNSTEWFEVTKGPFFVNNVPSKGSSLGCKVYFTPLTCLSLCSATVFYVALSWMEM